MLAQMKDSDLSKIHLGGWGGGENNLIVAPNPSDQSFLSPVRYLLPFFWGLFSPHLFTNQPAKADFAECLVAPKRRSLPLA